MKLCTFEIKTHLGKHRRLGAVTPEGIVDLNFTCAWSLTEKGDTNAGGLAAAMVPDNMLAFLEAGERAKKAAADALEARKAAGATSGPNEETLLYKKDQVTILPPLPDPVAVLDFFAFEDHVKKGFEKRGEPMPEEWYQIPVYYKSGHKNIIGTEQDAHWPSFTEKFDYELELAAVIGRKGRNIKASDARAYIAGYTIMNDFSARDIQRREMKVRLGPAKGKDWCTALGPYLVTADEISDPYNLRMAARINGELWSHGTSSSMHWKFEQMIEFLSQDDTIWPGQVIGSGTVGSGCGLELDRWVQPGDVIELAVEKLGVLRNKVVRD